MVHVNCIDILWMHIFFSLLYTYTSMIFIFDMTLHEVLILV